MSIFSRFTPISTALLPNAEIDDIKLVLISFLPWKWGEWRNGQEIEKLENKFKEYFVMDNAFGFSSGRAGLYAILKSIAGLSGSTNGAQDPEVIIQAYTTIAIPIVLKKAGFIPVYADIKESTYNIDPDKIEGKITPLTKAVIVQHTFGIPAEMDRIGEICKKHGLFLIEDCAHSLGAEYGPSNSSGQAVKKIGIFGDAAFFSFGRDKIISSTSGGMVILNNSVLREKIKEFHYGLNFPSATWIFRQLMHPLVFWCSLPVYYFLNIGKFKIYLSQKIGIISRAYSGKEKNGNTDDLPVYKFPNILAVLALNQFGKLERFNGHRRKLGEIYRNNFHSNTLERDSKIKVQLNSERNRSVFLYYTILAERRDELLKFAAKNHIILGDWFPGALGPKGIDTEKFGYKKGDCPIAERVGLRSLNLPTNIKTSEKDAEKIATLIKSFLNKKI